MATKIVYLKLKNDAVNGNDLELGFSDGNPGGATSLDIFSGLDGANMFNASHPHFFTQLGDKILFFAKDATSGRELWITDGTAGGTSLVKDIHDVAPTANNDSVLNNGNFNSQSQIDSAKPVVIGGTMYFAASDGVHGMELWKTDGTPGGTSQVKDINPSGTEGSNPQYLVDLNGTLYFVANDGTNGPQLWKSDGTPGNTVPVTNLPHPPGTGIHGVTVSGNLIYFIFNDGSGANNAQQVYVTDGSVNTQHLLDPAEPAILDPRNFADINGTLYFCQNDNVHGFELWKSDGTPGGTTMVKDIYDDGMFGPAAPSGVPFGFHEYNGEVYFVATDGTNGFEIWKTNGTDAGTTMLTDINLEPLGAGTENAVFDPFAFAEYKGELYFAARDGIQPGKHNIELWKTNGTPGGTVLVADLFAGNSPGSPTELLVIDDVLYFGANAVGGGFGQMFRYDGVNPATMILSDYHYGAGHEPFSYIIENTPPVQNANTGATVNEGQSTTVLNAQLDFNDAEQSDAQIVYTLTTLPTNGTLFRNAVALAMGGTFTQADIIGNLVTYTHNGSETIADLFGFSLSDGIAPALVGQTFAITVMPQNDAPVITSNGGGAAANVMHPENATAVTTVTASDPDGPSLAFSIIGGSDAGKFQIDAATGALSFVNAPNFEAPGDSDANNSYVVQVRASDGSLNDDQTITVNVTDVAPELAKKYDFNADGKADILWQNLDGQPGIWLMNGLVRVAGANVGFNPNGSGQAGGIGPWTVKGSGDFNGDGRADILWQNDDGGAGIWLMDGFTVLQDGGVGFNPGPTWHVIDSGDFNGDSKSDILWQNDNGTVGIWTMDGLPRLAGANIGSNPGPSWKAKAAGDFNGDGKADILWQNDDGTAGVWLMDGFTLLNGANVGLNPGPTWKVIDAGDFNGDGKSDILWQNDNGTAGIWLMDGLTQTDGGNVGGFNPGPSWKVKAAADYNGDNKADILWQNLDGTPGIWLMDGLTQIDGANVGFNPGPTWHVVGQVDLI